MSKQPCLMILMRVSWLGVLLNRGLGLWVCLICCFGNVEVFKQQTVRSGWWTWASPSLDSPGFPSLWGRQLACAQWGAMRTSQSLPSPTFLWSWRCQPGLWILGSLEISLTLVKTTPLVPLLKRPLHYARDMPGIKTEISQALLLEPSGKYIQNKNTIVIVVTW